MSLAAIERGPQPSGREATLINARDFLNASKDWVLSPLKRKIAEIVSKPYKPLLTSDLVTAEDLPLPSGVDIAGVNSASQERARTRQYEQILGLTPFEPEPAGRARLALTVAGAGLALLTACTPTQAAEVSPVSPTRPADVTAAPGVGGGLDQPVPTFEPNSAYGKELNPIINRYNDPNTRNSVSQEDLNKVNAAKAAEAEQLARCSFSGDSKFCDLAEVYQGNNPRTGKFKGIGIKVPSDPEATIEIVSPFDGWLHPTLDNPRRGSISTQKDRVVEGWVIDGPEFKETHLAEASPVKKGEVVATLKVSDYRPLSYAPDYLATFSPRSANEEPFIKEHFPLAARKPVKEVIFQSAGTRTEQGPVIVQNH